MDLLFVLTAFVLSLLASFFFSGTETAVITASRYRLRHDHEEGDERAGRTLALLSQPARLMTTALIGTNLANVFAVLLFKHVLDALWPRAATRAVGFVNWDEVICLAVLTPAIVTLAEVLPKSLFRARADAWIRSLTPPLRWFSRLFAPVIVVLDGLVGLLLRPVGGRHALHGPPFTRSDLLVMLQPVPAKAAEEAEGESAPAPAHPLATHRPAPGLEPNERGLIQNIIELDQTQAREIMQPLAELEAIPLGRTSIEDFLGLARASGYSRYPVYRDRIVNLAGFVDIYDVIRDAQGRSRLEDFVRPAHYVPETKRVDDLLQEFLEQRISNAVVVDEYGGCSGWVTREDIIEEIVGEIEDELDEPAPLIREQPDGSYLIDGRVDPEDVADITDFALEDPYCDTFAGVVVKEMGRIPKVGDEITLEGRRLRIEEMDGLRVALVSLRKVRSRGSHPPRGAEP